MNRVNIGDDRVFSIADLEREGTAKMVTHIAQYYNEGAMDLATYVWIILAMAEEGLMGQAEREHPGFQPDQAERSSCGKRSCCGSFYSMLRRQGEPQSCVKI